MSSSVQVLSFGSVVHTWYCFFKLLKAQSILVTSTIHCYKILLNCHLSKVWGLLVRFHWMTIPAPLVASRPSLKLSKPDDPLLGIYTHQAMNYQSGWIESWQPLHASGESWASISIIFVFGHQTSDSEIYSMAQDQMNDQILDVCCTSPHNLRLHIGSPVCKFKCIFDHFFPGYILFLETVCYRWKLQNCTWLSM